jgi:hypothetical protein
LDNDDDSSKALLTAVNSRFDMNQVAIGNTETKALNEGQLRKIEKDNYIAEAYLIMTDWLNIK